jgi:hypothetical protein
MVKTREYLDINIAGKGVERYLGLLERMVPERHNYSK